MPLKPLFKGVVAWCSLVVVFRRWAGLVVCAVCNWCHALLLLKQLRMRVNTAFSCTEIGHVGEKKVSG